MERDRRFTSMSGLSTARGSFGGLASPAPSRTPRSALSHRPAGSPSPPGPVSRLGLLAHRHFRLMRPAEEVSRTLSESCINRCSPVRAPPLAAPHSCRSPSRPAGSGTPWTAPASEGRGAPRMRPRHARCAQIPATVFRETSSVLEIRRIDIPSPCISA